MFFWSFVILQMSGVRWKIGNCKFLRFAVRCCLQKGVFAFFEFYRRPSSASCNKSLD